MTTTRLASADVTIVYVDPAAAGTNDGTSPTNALTSLAAHNTFAANTLVIVRRGASVTWTPGTNANARVGIIGMPRTGDFLYRYMPAEVTSVWDADAADYAILTIAAGNTQFTHTGNYLTLHRLDIRQPITGTNFVGSTNFHRFNITANGTRVTNCKFGVAGYDLNVATAAPGRASGAWRITGNFTYVADCDFQFVEEGSGTGYASSLNGWLAVTGTDTEIERCTFISTNCYSNSNFPACYLSGDRPIVTNCTFKGVAYCSSPIGAATWWLGTGLRVTSCFHPIIKNVDWTYLRRITYAGGTGTTTSTITAWAVGAIFVDAFLGGEFENLTADLTTNWDLTGSFTGMSLVRVSASLTNGHPKPTTVTGVVAKIADAGNGTSATNAVILELPPNSLATGITAWHMQGFGFSATANDPAGGNGAGSLEIDSIKGKIDVRGSYRVHCVTLSSTVQHSPQINLTNSGTTTTVTGTGNHTEALFESVTWPVAQTSNMITIDDETVLAIENLNVTPIFSGQSDDALLVVNNENGVAGSWRCETIDNRLATVNAFRTGGAATALKLTPKANAGDPVYLGPKPFPGLTIAAATVGAVGTRTITVHAAYKNYTNGPNPENLWLELTIPDGTTGTKKRVITTRGFSNWEADGGSVWNNDSGLTQLKFTFTFPFDRLEPIQLRVGAEWFQSGAYCLIDPLPVFG